MISFFRKINIFYKNIVKSIRRAFHEFGEEVFIIIRNRNYAKKHPNLFAIFSIIEQEQNTQIFELQKEEFHKIKANVLKDKDASNHHILEALRGLFNNNKILSNQNEIRQQLSAYLFEKTKKLINENNRYYMPLIKVILFSFPFLLSYENYTILRKLIKRKSNNSLRLVKDILDNYETLDFLEKLEDISSLILVSIAFDNKPAFMMLMRFLRKSDKISIIFNKRNSNIRTKILNINSVNKRGLDYTAIMLSYYDDRFFIDSEHQNLSQFLSEILSNQLKLKEKTKRYDKINTYLVLSRQVGYQNSIIEGIIKEYITKDEISVHMVRPRILRIKNIRKVLFENSAQPRTKIKIQTILNMTNQHPEEYWLMQFAPYLL